MSLRNATKQNIDERDGVDDEKKAKRARMAKNQDASGQDFVTEQMTEDPDNGDEEDIKHRDLSHDTTDSGSKRNASISNRSTLTNESKSMAIKGTEKEVNKSRKRQKIESSNASHNVVTGRAAAMAAKVAIKQSSELSRDNYLTVNGNVQVSTPSNTKDSALVKLLTQLVKRIEKIAAQSLQKQLEDAEVLSHINPHKRERFSLDSGLQLLSKGMEVLVANIKSGKFFEDCKIAPTVKLMKMKKKKVIAPSSSTSSTPSSTTITNSASTVASNPGNSSHDPVFVKPRVIKWASFEKDLFRILSLRLRDSEFTVPPKILEEIATEKKNHHNDVMSIIHNENIRRLQERNGEPAVKGNKWRKEPYPPRKYEQITNYVTTTTIPLEEGAECERSLETPLSGYLGQPYNYDDHVLSEEWMCAFQSNISSEVKVSDKQLIRAQIESHLDAMIGQVQDRVCNETGVLKKNFVELGPDIKECPVWGIDCYTRKMVELVLEDRVPSHMYNSKQVKHFIERFLLPAINAQSEENAHNMQFAASYIMKLPNLSETFVTYANALSDAIQDHGIDTFQIHPKGTGTLCTKVGGIAPRVAVCAYLGELYPPYRWCERLEVIEQAQKHFNLKPSLPDFYNILLERPRQDPDGYGLFWVDASRKANMGSTVSHACDANCTSAIVARDGKLAIAMTTTRHVNFGEELTHDYCSLTNSEKEWQAAICLCGMTECRGSFLHYATAEDLQQILTKNCGPLWRYASLLRSCSERPLSSADLSTLDRHGMRSAAFGPNAPLWMKKYAAVNLRFIEFERKALPCALMLPSKGKKTPSPYTVPMADLDARSVMEQRIQSMVCCFSMTRKFLSVQPPELQNTPPLRHLPPSEVIDRIWELLKDIPSLIKEYVTPGTVSLDDLASNSSGRGKKPIGDSGSNQNHKQNTNGQKSKIGIVKGNDKVKYIANKEKITGVVTSIQSIIEIKPSGMNALREAIMKVRKEILSISLELQNPKARLNLLADILVLYANTTYFSCTSKYKEHISDPIVVVSRELGSNIPQNILLQKLEKAQFAFNRESSHTSGDVKHKKNTTSSAPSSHSTSSKLPASSGHGGLLDPNEPVYTGTKKYDETFVCSQMLDWFSAGTDMKGNDELMDLVGCVQLPEPIACFGTSLSQYGKDERRLLINLLRNEKASMMPWPAKLKQCLSTFNSDSNDEHELDEQSSAPKNKISSKKKVVDKESKVREPLYGSPMLDMALGKGDSVHHVLSVLMEGDGGAARKMIPQLNYTLPPETSTDWVQCESCHKWRRVAYHVDAEALPDKWVCSLNHWDPDHADCSAPSDSFDSLRETTLSINATDDVRSGLLEIGSLRDVWCIQNKYYYEAKVVELKEPQKPGQKTKIKFHFLGWDDEFDEWINEDSDRIQAHHLYTNPTSSDPCDHELWQEANSVGKGFNESITFASTHQKKKPRRR